MPQFIRKYPFLWALLAIVAAGPSLRAQDHSGVYPPMDIQNGALLYGANCAQCHGATGDGVPGVDLKAGIRRVSTDQQLAQLVTNGIPGTAMPATPFALPEVSALVAYLRRRKSTRLNSSHEWISYAVFCLKKKKKKKKKKRNT